MKKLFNLVFISILCSISFVSCSDEEEISDMDKHVASIYVLNEGNDNGSVSLIGEDDIVTNNYFAKMNSDIPLGQYAQTMAVNDDYAFIVVTTSNGAGYVEVVDKSTFVHVKTIGDLSYPREITLVDNKAYLSNGSGMSADYMQENSQIYVINMESLSITDTIEVGAGPEKLIASNGKLYVANSGGWSNDKTVSVIDIESDKVVNTIEVKDCPTDMVSDINGSIWVYCKGVPSYDNWPLVTYSNSGLSRIDGSTSEVTSFDLSNISTTGIKNIAISKEQDVIYYISDGVYAMDINATTLPENKLIDKIFYGIDVNPEDGNIWGCDVTTATDPGSVIVYSPQGVEIKKFTVGIMPNSTVFCY